MIQDHEMACVDSAVVSGRFGVEVVAARAGGGVERADCFVDRGDSWTVGTGTYEGKLIITRWDTGLRAVAGNAAFPVQVGIAVAFRDPTDEGLPPREETAKLDAIEDAIQALFCARNESFLAGVVTTGGMREFVLYTSNGDAARRKAEQLVRDFPRHKVSFVLNPDANWNVYRQLLDR